MELFIEQLMRGNEDGAREIIRDFIAEAATEQLTKIREGRARGGYADESGTAGNAEDVFGGMEVDDRSAADLPLNSDIPILDVDALDDDPSADIDRYASGSAIGRLNEKIDRSDEGQDLIDDISTDEAEIESEKYYGKVSEGGSYIYGGGAWA